MYYNNRYVEHGKNTSPKEKHMNSKRQSLNEWGLSYHDEFNKYDYFISSIAFKF